MITLNSQGGMMTLGNEGWLPLHDYSTKYHISVSTLRRRIRANTIEHQFRDGKYWIKDKPMARAYHTSQPDLASVRTESAPLPDVEASALEKVNQLVAELKSAYVLILQEKEEQILQLKEEVADLKTLVRILEAQNDKNQLLDKAEAQGLWSEENLEP